MVETSPSDGGNGRLAAENLDLRLRLVETRERMVAICADRSLPVQATGTTRRHDQRQIDPLEDGRNRRLLREHLELCHAIASSLPWKVVEFAARPYDRSLVNPAASVTASDIQMIRDPMEVRRLLDESGEYMARVLGSKQWRWLQSVRGFFRRRW